MFGSAHPRPPHRKEVAMQVIRQERKSFDKTLGVEVPGGAVALPPGRQAIRFDAAPSVPEYLSMLRDHLAFLARRAGPGRRLRATVVPLALGLPALAAAWLAGPGPTGTAMTVAALLALGSLPVTTSFWVLLLGTPVFLYKKRSMPRASFVIDGRGIERTTRAGTQSRSWAELRAVRRYSRGYLLLFANGAVPIPFRCLSREQQETFRRLAWRRGITPPA